MAHSLGSRFLPTGSCQNRSWTGGAGKDDMCCIKIEYWFISAQWDATSSRGDFRLERINLFNLATELSTFGENVQNWCLHDDSSLCGWKRARVDDSWGWSMRNMCAWGFLDWRSFSDELGLLSTVMVRPTTSCAGGRGSRIILYYSRGVLRSPGLR